jgi:sugar phosphate isomerase/epimerase
MPFPPLAVQLIIFGQRYRLDQEADAITVLDAVKAAGFTAVEGAGGDPQRFRELLDARGLRCGALHIAISGKVDPEDLARRMKILGASDCCNSGVLTWDTRDEACYLDSAKRLNEIGSALKKHGIRFHYHNHEFEFTERFNGRSGMDILLAELDPTVCDLCVDVAWVVKGGEDPVAFLRRHAERIGYVHLKDFDDQGWTELGRGKVPLKAVVDILPELPNVQWVAAEQDNTTRDPADSVRESRAWLRDACAWA